MYTVAVIILVLIIVFLVFRLLKQKVPKTKKSTMDHVANKMSDDGRGLYGDKEERGQGCLLASGYILAFIAAPYYMDWNSTGLEEKANT